MFDNINFVTYANNNFYLSRKILLKEAADFGFKNIFSFSLNTLPKDFLSKHFEFIEKNKRGGGLYIWKPLVVKMALDQIKTNDFLIWVDSGCGVNPYGKDRFKLWVDICNEKNVLFFLLPFVEKNYTKKSLLELMGCNNPKFYNTGQIAATTFMLKKTDLTIQLVDKWLSICELHWPINNVLTENHEHPDFIEHRHDQSVLSLLVKKNEFFHTPDETFPYEETSRLNEKQLVDRSVLEKCWLDFILKGSPILALRRRESMNKLTI
jgi:hypothetical protein